MKGGVDSKDIGRVALKASHYSLISYKMEIRRQIGHTVPDGTMSTSTET